MSVAIGLKPAKPKITVSAVQGKIIVMAEDGERIGQWGGTECYLSIQSGLGPCFIARSARHKRHEGTFFQLSGLRHVLSSHVAQGKLTIVVPHARRVCSVYVETTTDVNELRMMAGILQDRSQWKYIERNVAVRSANSGQRGRPRSNGLGGGAVEVTRDSGGPGVTRGLRDPTVAELENEEKYLDWGDGDEDDDDANSNGQAPPQQPQEKGAFESPEDASASMRSAPTKTSRSAASRASASAVSLAERERAKWSAEQTRALHNIVQGRNVFVTGAAGTGKTEWLLHVIRHVLPSDETTAVTAVSGIAARQIGGHTVYSFAGIGRGEGSYEAIVHRVRSRPDVVRAWQACRVLVIDEIGMLPGHIFTLLDSLAREVRREPAKAFGGIQLILVGDFLQLPPVSKAGEEVQRAFVSSSWGPCAMACVQFQRNYRHAEDVTFAMCCADVRRGCYTHAVDEVLASCVDRPLEERFGVTATTILSRRKDVEAYNAAQLEALDSVQFVRYLSEDYAAMPGANIDNEIASPAVLTLKAGAQVVLLSSLPEDPTLSNGERGVVVGFADQAHGPALPIVRFASGDEVMVPQVRSEVFDRDGRVSMARTQVPLQLAWALTVHRVQGMTLPMARIRLDHSFFEAGQAYVALSRVRRAEDLSLLALDPAAIQTVDAATIAFYDTLFPPTPQQRAEREAQRASEQALLQERKAALAQRRRQRSQTASADPVSFSSYPSLPSVSSPSPRQDHDASAEVAMGAAETDRSSATKSESSPSRLSAGHKRARSEAEESEGSAWSEQQPQQGLRKASTTEQTVIGVEASSAHGSAGLPDTQLSMTLRAALIDPEEETGPAFGDAAIDALPPYVLSDRIPQFTQESEGGRGGGGMMGSQASSQPTWERPARGLLLMDDDEEA